MKTFDCYARGIAVFIIGTVLSWTINLSIILIAEDANGVRASVGMVDGHKFPYIFPAFFLTGVFLLAGIFTTVVSLDNKR